MRQKPFILVAVALVCALLALPARAEEPTHAYVVSDGGAVLVVDQQTKAQVASITLGSRPNSAVFSRDGRWLYVTNYWSDNVSVIDVATNTVTATVPVGDGPRSLALTPDGARIYVGNFDDGSVSVISTAANAVTATIALFAGAEPIGTAVMPDGAHVYMLTRPNGGGFSIIDTATNTVVDTASLGFNNIPSGMVMSENGSRIYVSARFHKAVGVFETVTNTRIALIPLGGEGSPGITLSPDGTRLYATAIRSDPSIQVIDTLTNAIVATIPVADGHSGLRFTPDEKEIWVIRRPNSVITIIDPVTNTVASTFSIIQPNDVVFTPAPLNSPPVVSVSGGGVYELGSQVTLGGTVADNEADEVTVTWRNGMTTLFTDVVGTTAGGAPVALPEHEVDTLPLGVGVHTLSVSVDDGTNDAVVAEVEVTVKDTSAPTLAPVVDHGILWPPNHKLVSCTIQVNAADNDGQPPQLSATVASDEPDDGLGDGDTPNDIQNISVDGATGTITVDLRAERQGGGDGRTYTITIEATDGNGNSSMAEVTVIVPSDKKKK